MAEVKGGAWLPPVQSGESPEGLGLCCPEVAHVVVREEAGLRHSERSSASPGPGEEGSCCKGPTQAHLRLLPTGQRGQKPLLTAPVVHRPCRAQGPLVLWPLREAQGVGAGGRERGDPFSGPGLELILEEGEEEEGGGEAEQEEEEEEEIQEEEGEKEEEENGGGDGAGGRAGDEVEEEEEKKGEGGRRSRTRKGRRRR